MTRSKVANPPPVPAGLLDGNGRTARLARWLRDIPKRKELDTLVLEMKTDDGWQRMQCWDRVEAGMHLALAIDAAVTDLANECGAFVTCQVAWLDSKSGQYWTAHALRAQPEGMSGQQAFGGDAQSAAIQTQRGLERLVGAYMGGIETSQRMCERSAEIAQAAYESRENEVMVLRERCALLERENAELGQQLEAAIEAGERLEATKQESSQQNQAIGIFQQLMASQLAKPAAS